MIKRDCKYLIAIFICCFVVPHIFMGTPEFREFSSEPWYEWRDTLFLRMYTGLIWLGIPLSVAAVTLWHVLEGGSFSPAILIEVILIFLSYLLRLESKYVAYLSFAIPIAILHESLLLVRPHVHDGKEGKTNGLAVGFVENRQFLALICFVSVSLIMVAQIYFSLLHEWNQNISIFLVLCLIPLPLVMTFITMIKRKRITKGGAVGLLCLFVLSSIVCTSLYFHVGWLFHLFLVICGYAIIPLMEIVIRPAMELGKP